jgi:hypothetical protein
MCTGMISLKSWSVPYRTYPNVNDSALVVFDDVIDFSQCEFVELDYSRL